jgi:hypothetical protein
MKNKIALAAAFMAATSYSTAEIVINDFLSFEGFVDMSYTHTDTEVDSSASRISATDMEDADNSFAIDQVEISWLFDFDPVTAQIDLAYEGSDSPRTNNDGGEVEQAFATYHLDNGGAITAGRYASMLGFEAFEPTGLYQYSFGYDMIAGDVSVLPLYAQGVKYTYEADMTFFGLSVQDSAYDYDQDRLGGDDRSSYAVEAAGSIAMDNGLSFFLGGVFEDAEDAAGNDADTYTINAYSTFETGAWIFAAEVNYSDSDGGRALSGLYSNGGALGDNILDATFGAGPFATNPAIAGSEEEVIQALLMANFAYSENASVTGRITYSDHDADGSLTAAGTGAVTPLNLDGEFFKYTLAHGYAFTDNLFLVTEVSYVDGETELSGPGNVKGDFDVEGLQGAVELIFSF